MAGKAFLCARRGQSGYHRVRHIEWPTFFLKPLHGKASRRSDANNRYNRYSFSLSSTRTVRASFTWCAAAVPVPDATASALLALVLGSTPATIQGSAPFAGKKRFKEAGCTGARCPMEGAKKWSWQRTGRCGAPSTTSIRGLAELAAQVLLGVLLLRIVEQLSESPYSTR